MKKTLLLPALLLLTSCTMFRNDTLRDGDVIGYAPATPEVQQQAQFLADYVAQLTDVHLQVREGTSGTILLNASDTVAQRLGDEGYRLRIAQHQIQVDARTPRGLFYGAQELRQLLPIQPSSRSISLPDTLIQRTPRFAYRGMMLDCARHYFPLDFVKRYIDMVALHQMNTLHWHLTDNQAWRFEVKRYPQLVAEGGRHEHLLDGAPVTPAFPERGDVLPPTDQPRYYTQEECREIVAYAAQRHITVIPEIDMPGHMRAATSIMPQLSCRKGLTEVEWGSTPDVLCLGSQLTLDWAKDILGELLEVFPSTYIHVGGDECPKGEWARCSTCQALARKLGLRKTKEWTIEEQLQSHFIAQLEQYLNDHGRQLIGWDETLEGGPAPHATIMTWRSVDEGIKAVRLGHDVIMAPGSHCYFDGYQSKDLQHEPLAIGGYLPLSKVYDFEPIPDTLTVDEAAHVIGVQANLWTEYIAHGAHAEYMVLPRMAALREVQWRQPDQAKDYAAFAQRVPHLLDLYQQLGYHYARHLLDVTLTAHADTLAGATRVELQSIAGAQIRYTLDGSEPTAQQGTLYTEPLAIAQSCQLRAIAQYNGREGRIMEQSFDVNLATNCPITLLHEPHRSYTFAGATTLVDGISVGNTGYGSGGWLGWGGRDMVATIDLRRPQTVHQLHLNAIVLPNSWIFGPERVTVETSPDGIHFMQQATQSFPDGIHYDQPANTTNASHLTVNQVASITLTFPPVTARYVRVTASPLQHMPRWHNGAGLPAFVFVDEIGVAPLSPPKGG